MKLEYPLSELIRKCESICVKGCCGIDAYDFSPIHIASFLIMYTGAPEEKVLRDLKSQLEALAANYGENGASAKGVTLEEMNQKFSGKKLDQMVTEISQNIQLALVYIKEAERQRYSNA